MVRFVSVVMAAFTAVAAVAADTTPAVPRDAYGPATVSVDGKEYAVVLQEQFTVDGETKTEYRQVFVQNSFNEGRQAPRLTYINHQERFVFARAGRELLYRDGTDFKPVPAAADRITDVQTVSLQGRGADDANVRLVTWGYYRGGGWRGGYYGGCYRPCYPRVRACYPIYGGCYNNVCRPNFYNGCNGWNGYNPGWYGGAVAYGGVNYGPGYYYDWRFQIQPDCWN